MSITSNALATEQRAGQVSDLPDGRFSLRQSLAEPAVSSTDDRGFEVMFPISPNGEAAVLQPPTVGFVTQRRPREFGRPVRGVGFRNVSVHRAGVIETAVHEDHQIQRRNNDVRTTGEILNVRIYPPSMAQFASHKIVQLALGCSSAGPDAGHDLTSLLGCEDVWHRRLVKETKSRIFVRDPSCALVPLLSHLAPGLHLREAHSKCRPKGSG